MYLQSLPILHRELRAGRGEERDVNSSCSPPQCKKNNPGRVSLMPETSLLLRPSKLRLVGGKTNKTKESCLVSKLAWPLL
jgi:hypothetical protein